MTDRPPPTRPRTRIPGWAVALVMLAIAGGLGWLIYELVGGG